MRTRGLSAAWTVMGICLCAQATDFTVVVFEDRLFNQPNPVQEVDVTFPSDGTLYSKVDLILTLEPPDGLDGDEWDRMGHIFMYDDKGDWTELARLITPYWNPPWTWTLDITEMQLLLTGDRRLGVWLQSWKDDGYQVSVSLEFTIGTPAMQPIKINNLWTGSMVGYGNVGNTQMEQWLTPYTIPISEYADQVLSRISVTGHRFVDNTENGAEFLQRGRTLMVNGGGAWYNLLWQLCGNWPVQPQSPATWYFDRAGWCPGDLVDPWIVDVTSQVFTGQDTVLEYIPDEYINLGTAQDATHHFGSQLVQLAATDSMIVSPDYDFDLGALTDEDLNGREKVFHVHNHNATSIDVAVTKTSSWLNISPAGLTVLPGESGAVTITLNAGANNLSEGSYAGLVSFTDTTNSYVEERGAFLELEDKALVAHWKLDETSGTTAFDASGHGHEGTLAGDLNFETHSVPGMQGGALDFDGVDDLINAGAVPIHGPFSIVAWVYPKDIANQSGFAYKWAQNQRTFWFGPHNNDGVLHFGVYPSIFQKSLNSPDPVLVNDTWTHVVATYDGHFQKMYINGDLVATSEDRNANLQERPGDFILGRYNNNYYDGYLDDMRIYNYDLSADDIHRLLCPADLNGDNQINAGDLPQAYDYWPDSGLLPDLNGDGRHNILDILVLSTSSGTCP